MSYHYHETLNEEISTTFIYTLFLDTTRPRM